MSTATSRSPQTFAIPAMAGLDTSSRRVMSLRKPKSDIQALGFSQLPGAAVFIAASPDGTFWVLSPNGLPSGDKFIYHYVNGTFVNVPGAATRLAVGPDNTVWALNAAGGIYHSSNGRFIGIGGGASEISIAADGSVYVVSNQPGGPFGRGLYRYANGAWTQLPGAGVTISASIDSGTYDGGIIAPGGFYVTNSADSIFYYNLASGYTQLPGAAVSLAPTASGGVFALGNPGAIQHGIYYNDLDIGRWQQMPGAAVGIATAGSNVFALGAAGGIYVSPILPGHPNPPSPTPRQVTVAPVAVSFTAAPAAPQNVTVFQSNNVGGFTVSGCTGIASAPATTMGTLPITAVAAGVCTLSVISKIDGQSATITVTVTTTTINNS